MQFVAKFRCQEGNGTLREHKDFACAFPHLVYEAAKNWRPFKSTQIDCSVLTDSLACRALSFEHLIAASASSSRTADKGVRPHHPAASRRASELHSGARGRTQ
jgi:hypothetical protein